jgi:hypothetical protein
MTLIDPLASGLSASDVADAVSALLATRGLLAADLDDVQVLTMLLRHVDHAPIVRGVLQEASRSAARRRLARAYDIDPDDEAGLDALEDLLVAEALEASLAPVIPLQRRV